MLRQDFRSSWGPDLRRSGPQGEHEKIIPQQVFARRRPAQEAMTEKPAKLLAPAFVPIGLGTTSAEHRSNYQVVTIREFSYNAGVTLLAFRHCRNRLSRIADEWRLSY
jgi:hypothetical protein